MNKKRWNEGIVKVGVKDTIGSKNVKRDIQTPSIFFVEYISQFFHGAIWSQSVILYPSVMEE